MILVSLLDNSTQKFIILEKAILRVYSRPQPGKIRQKLPGCGLELRREIGFSKIVQKY